jgi:hypothetical protein
MSVGSGLAHGHPLALDARVRARARDHRFFTGMAVTCALVVFVGFAPSYYLKGYFGGGREMAALVHLHGVLSTGWMLLLVVQTSLVGAGRTDLHRRLGLLGLVMVPVLTAVGLLTAVEGARHGVTPPGGPPPLAFLAIPFGTILTFAAFATLGLHFRRRSDTHKRLMLLATIAMLIPAFARMRWLAGGGPPVGMTGTALLIAGCMGYDRLAHGRIHPAFLWGGLALLVSMPLRFALSRTEAWLGFARWLTGSAG